MRGVITPCVHALSVIKPKFKHHIRVLTITLCLLLRKEQGSVDVLSELIITAGNRPISAQCDHVACQSSCRLTAWLVKVSNVFSSLAFKSSSAGHGTSTSSVSTSSTSSDECSSCFLFTKKPKRQAKVSTFEKWKRELNMEHKTSLRLRCDKDTTDKTLVLHYGARFVEGMRVG